MRAINFIKNNFLLVIFLCAFVLPVGVFAVTGDVSNNIINYTGGSYYNTAGSSGLTQDKKEGITATQNLWSKNQQKVEVSTAENDILSKKLKTGGIEFDTTKLTTKNITVKNTGDVSIFEYDPTPDDVTNNDSVILAVATKEGQFYIAQKPVKVETGSNTSTDSLTANGFLNMIDGVYGRPIGTTITAKNNIYNRTQQLKLDQQKVTEAGLNQQKTWDDLQAAKARNASPEEIASLTALNEAATNQQRLASTQGNQNNQKLIAAQESARKSAINEDTTCDSILSLTSSFCLLTVVSKFTNIIFKLTSFIAYIAGTLFDYSLELSINSAEFFKKLGIIEITWSFIRDILNMTFIFILLWTAIQILITNDAKYNAKKILINVIVVAILMNFSLFAAKLMVDGSNVVSLKMYEAMKANTGNKGSSISVRIMDTVGVTTLYNVSQIFNEKTFQAEGTCAKNPGAMITISVMGSIFLIVLILALGLAAILFLIRLVNIIFLFIKSPLWVWGYVIPGNKMMGKLKDNWQSEMKHVLLFPIAYLFWMLVAVIIFEKIGTATKELGGSSTSGGLLGLICKNPENAGGSASISLVAIFVIVIIFMMKAIEYGVKHANDGGSEALGGGINNWATKKFSGYQTAMTTGLAKKAGTLTTSAVVGASVGATKVPLRAVTGLAGGIHSARNKEGFWKGANDGFSNPGINLKEMTGGVLGRAAILTGSQTLARKAVALTEETTKSRKDKDDKITKGSKEKEENLQKIAAKEYKIDTQEQWEKKNGDIGNDVAKADKYKEYIEKQIEKRAGASLGNKKIIHADNKDGIKHLDAIRAKAISQEVDTATGKIKIKINNREVATGLGDVLKYHTTGKGAQNNPVNKKGLWKPFRTKKAEARVKAAETALKAEESKYSNDQAEKDLDVMIKKTEEKLANMPDDKLLDDIVNSTVKNKITSTAKNYSDIKKLNNMIDKHRKLTSRKLTAATPAEKDHIVDELNELDEKMSEHVEKIKKSRNDDAAKLIKKKNEVEKIKEKKAKENK